MMVQIMETMMLQKEEHTFNKSTNFEKSYSDSLNQR